MRRCLALFVLSAAVGLTISAPVHFAKRSILMSMLNTEGGDYDEENEHTAPIYSMRRRRAGGQAPEASAPDHEYGGSSGCAADCQCGCRDRLEHDRGQHRVCRHSC